MILHLENLEVEEQKLQFFPKMQRSCTKKRYLMQRVSIGIREMNMA